MPIVPDEELALLRIAQAPQLANQEPQGTMDKMHRASRTKALHQGTLITPVNHEGLPFHNRL